MSPWTYLKLLNVLISPASILCPSICSSSQVPVQFIVIIYIVYILIYSYNLYNLVYFAKGTGPDHQFRLGIIRLNRRGHKKL